MAQETFPAADDPWKAAVIDALVTAHIYTAAHESDPRGALKALLAYEQAVALDPAVSSDAAALIERGRREARDALFIIAGLSDGQHADAAVTLKLIHDEAMRAMRAYDERSGK